MKFVVALDSFKESMSALSACNSTKEGILSVDASSNVDVVPLADGGEGTLRTLVDALNGNIITTTVTSLLNNPIEIELGICDDLGIIECATMCGLELLTDDQKNPYNTTTYGLGEAILFLVNQGCKKLLICLGGSATNDGGIGMLNALGVNFLDENNETVKLTASGLKDIVHIDNHLNPKLQDVEIIGVCDVLNPLCGKNGATYIYGPQKGLKEKDLELIDQAMLQYGTLSDHLLNSKNIDTPSTGAAGGLGYAIKAYLNGNLKPGFKVVAEVTHLEDRIKDTDIVFVGEGKIDQQTQFGKTPYGVLQIAKKYHKPTIALAGKVEDEDVLKSLGFNAIYCISDSTKPLSYNLENANNNIKNCIINHLKEMIYDL